MFSTSGDGMSDEEKSPTHQALQFDRLVTDAPSSITQTTPSANCSACGNSIQTEYYSVNGHAVCGSCRQTIEAAAEMPRGAGPFVLAALFGLGAGVVGAAIYYAVIALLNLEIGIVAILIGYMVGFAVRKGAGNRGGRRFQVLAVALTYGAVALAYTPVVISAALKGGREQEQKADAMSNSSASSSLQATAEPPPTTGGVVLGIVMSLGFIAALPLLVVFGSMPSGLISAAIIFFGMQQAWKLTGVPVLQVLGPFRVGSESASQPA
jgi:hypothetical protein